MKWLLDTAKSAISQLYAATEQSLLVLKAALVAVVPVAVPVVVPILVLLLILGLARSFFKRFDANSLFRDWSRHRLTMKALDQGHQPVWGEWQANAATVSPKPRPRGRRKPTPKVRSFTPAPPAEQQASAGLDHFESTPSKHP